MLSNKLEFYRKQTGMTLLKLSEKTGLSAGYLCHLEKGSRTNPSISAMEKISVALDKTIAQIFFNEN